MGEDGVRVKWWEGRKKGMREKTGCKGWWKAGCWPMSAYYRVLETRGWRWQALERKGTNTLVQKRRRVCWNSHYKNPTKRQLSLTNNSSCVNKTHASQDALCRPLRIVDPTFPLSLSLLLCHFHFACFLLLPLAT